MAIDVYVVAIDKNPGELICEPNLEVIELNFSDKIEVLSFAKIRQIDGIYPMNDHAVQIAAYISKELGLPGLSISSADNFIDKSKMRTLWHESNLDQPKFQIVRFKEAATAAASEIGLPVIVKPSASGGGGRGVTRVDNIEALGNAFDGAVRENRYSQDLLVEEYIEGIESSIEMVFIHGIGSVVAMSSKVKANSDKQVAIEINYPAQIDDDIAGKIVELCQKAGLSLGISTGVAHFEVITNSKRTPILVEVGGRVGGGHTFHPIASHVSGINYPRLVANLYVGNLDICSKMIEVGVLRRGAVYAFPVTFEHGIISEIAFHETSNTDCEIHTEVWKSTGDTVSGLSDSLDRLGCVVALAQTQLEAARACRRTMESFVLQVENLDY